MILEAVVSAVNSVVFISDPSWSVNIPEDTGSNLVSFNSSCISIGTLMESDGKTKLRLGGQYSEPVGWIIFEGILETPGKMVSVSDALGNLLLEINVSASSTLLRIWVNDAREPDIISISAL